HVSEQARQQLAGLPQLKDVTNSMETSREVTLVPDPSRLMDLNVDTQTVGNAVRVAYQGSVEAHYAEPNGTERDVRVQLPAGLRYNSDAVSTLRLARGGDQTINVGQVTTTQTEQSPIRISRVNRQRIALLGADTNGVPLGDSVAATQQAMDSLHLPAGMRWSFAGQASDQ